MDIGQLLSKEDVKPVSQENYAALKQEQKLLLYSHTLGRYVTLNSGVARGEMQQVNVGLGPGSWY